MSFVRYRRWLFGCAAAWCAASALPLLLAWQSLPEPMASHWGIHGGPNGSLPRAMLLALHIGCVLLPAVLLRRGGDVAPVGLASVTFAGSLTTGLSVIGVLLNRGHARWQDAGHLSWLLMLAPVAAALALAALVHTLARRAWPGTPLSPASAEPLPLAQGERVYWSGSAHNHWHLVAISYLVIQGATLALVLGGGSASLTSALTHLLAFVALEAFSVLGVSVDERALTIRYGHLGLIRQRVPIERVAAASAFDLVPLEHGGWGYRGSLRWMDRAAVVVRRGPALRLDLTNGKRLSVTVDDADTAARLISAFLARRGVASARLESGAAPV